MVWGLKIVVRSFWSRVEGRVWGSGFGIGVVGVDVVDCGLWFRVQYSGFRFQVSGFRVQGSGFRVQVLGYRIQGAD